MTLPVSLSLPADRMPQRGPERAVRQRAVLGASGDILKPRGMGAILVEAARSGAVMQVDAKNCRSRKDQF
jgi:hypothetical protein